jgi:hypothetical protein
MAEYYTYDFVSPEEIYAEIKAEMRSYFNTGILNDTLFPIYTRKAMRKFNRSTLEISEEVLKIDNHSAALPLGFKYVRELWACSNVTETRKIPGAVYHQETCIVSPYSDYDPCNPCDTCATDCNTEKKIYYKTNEFYDYSYSTTHLLRPGNNDVRNQCSADCLNFRADGLDTFDVRDGKVWVNYPEGHLRLVYYSEPEDEFGDQMIPDNYRIQEFIKAHIKFRMYELLYNDVTDETYNQIAQKYATYKAEENDAYINADAEVKKQTVYQKKNSIARQRSRLNKYIIR